MTNLAGPRVFRHGTAGDYLLGFRAVDGTGMPFAGGAKVVKSAAGYNMQRLMVGSLGSLAVLTEVTLRVKPLVETESFVVCPLAEIASAEPLLVQLQQSPIDPAAIELLACGRGAACNWVACHDIPAGARAWLAVGLEGTVAEVDWMVDHLEKLLKKHFPRLEVHRLGPEATVQFRKTITDTVWRPLAAESPPCWIVELHLLPSSVVEAAGLVQRQWPEAIIACRAGDGIITARIGPQEGLIPRQLRQPFAAIVERDRGAMVVHHLGCNRGVSASEAWGDDPPGTSLMRELKRRFDPEGILNPGRMPFG